MPFHLLICHLYIPFGEMSVHVFCLFSNWIVFLQLSFENSYISIYIRIYIYMLFCVSFGSVKALKMLELTPI